MSDPILITGATGKIGRMLVRHFLESGNVVIATSRSTANLAALTVFPAAKDKLITVCADLGRAGGADHLTERLAAENLFPAALINNARDIDNLALEADGRASREAWLAEFELGVIAPYELAWQLAHQPTSTLSSVVNIGSMYGVVAANPSLYDDPLHQSPVHYGVVKAALIHLTKELSVRLAAKSIRVNTVSFGGIAGRADTDFHERYAKFTPLGRMLREDEVAGAIQFLISDAASGVTGHNLVVDGGWTAW
jgi:NAD(P)-dependent dehydrogenase (short-subunit alcohol dehydrogenase family)